MDPIKEKTNILIDLIGPTEDYLRNNNRSVLGDSKILSEYIANTLMELYKVDRAINKEKFKEIIYDTVQ